jgi:3-hydroxybutyryl-CoA dehydrogenase
MAPDSSKRSERTTSVSQPIERIGVVGCGQMGAGIAEVCARSGYSVIARDLSSDLVQRGLARIEASLDRAVARGKLSEEERSATRARIVGITDSTAFDGCDLVIEAVAEDLELKRRVFAELDLSTPPMRYLPATPHAARHGNGRCDGQAWASAGPALHAACAGHAAGRDRPHLPDER